jgi:hypothetical protein
MESLLASILELEKLKKNLESWWKFHLNVLLGGIRGNNTRCRIVYGQTNVGFEWIISEFLQKAIKVKTIISSYKIKQHPRIQICNGGDHLAIKSLKYVKDQAKNMEGLIK